MSPTFCLCSISKLWQQFRSSDNTEQIYAEYRAIVPNLMEVCSVYTTTNNNGFSEKRQKQTVFNYDDRITILPRERECLCHSLFVYFVRVRARVNSSALYDIYINQTYLTQIAVDNTEA